ncbi:hypothetical protein DXG01_006432 [Tephrocybe rancida]|nr:hypothetical protein DXG01_006432 [Tephrocybe rancida]
MDFPRAFHTLTDIVHNFWVLCIPSYYASQAAPLHNSQLVLDGESSAVQFTQISAMQRLDTVAETETDATTRLPLENVHIDTSPLSRDEWYTESHPSITSHEVISELIVETATEQPDTGDADVGSGATVTVPLPNDTPPLTHTSLPSTPLAHIPELIGRPTSHIVHDDIKSLWTMFIHDRRKEWLFLVSASGLILG